MTQIISIAIIITILMMNNNFTLLKTDGEQYEITINDQYIDWGSTAEDVYDLIGEPEKRIEQGADEILTYEDVETVFSDHSKIEFTIGNDNVIASDGQIQSSGLYYIQIEIEQENLETIEDILEKQYGEKLVISVDEKMQNQTLNVQEDGYFYKSCQNESWKLKNQENAEELIAFINQKNPYSNVDEESSLWKISMYGTQNDIIETCTITIDASKYILYQMFEQEN